MTKDNNKTIQDWLKKFFEIEDPDNVSFLEEGYTFLEKLGIHPDLNLENIKLAIEASGPDKVTEAHFFWLFAKIDISSQIKVIKDTLEKKRRKPKEQSTRMDKGILKLVEEGNIFSRLQTRDDSALRWLQIQIQRGFLYTEKRKENKEYHEGFNNKEMSMIVVRIFEAAFTEGSPIKDFFDNIDKEYGPFIKKDEPIPFMMRPWVAGNRI
jgi:hypothetical protein